ncbi:MAG: PCRF domain-containing protein, partial [Selenomonadaceae bacterium]|nr:PCRF domain-containing protein [Selenomonadaceae bacterium]
MDKLMTERLEALMTRYNQIQEDLQNDEVIANLKKYTELSRESRQLEPTFLAYSSYKNAIQTIEDAKILLLEDDEEMKEMAKLEIEEAEAKIEELEEKLK